MSQFKPDSASISAGVEAEDFRIRMLTIHDVVKDYDAIMSSLSHLKGIFGPDNLWPSPDLTLEQNLIDLGWHQKEFQASRSFAYTIMTRDESKCLGSVYVDPSDKEGYEAMVTFWVRASEADTGLEESLFEIIKMWMKRDWWFETVAFPGREISWEDWRALPDKNRA